MLLTGILDGETVLEDDYPVYPGYAYVAVGGVFPADGEVVASHIKGTALQLKSKLGADVLRRCELVKRAHS